MRLFSLILFLSFFSTQLFAFKDAFYIGATRGYSEGTVRTKELTKTREDYQANADISGLKFGSDLNLNRSHQLKGRWEYALEKRLYTYEKNDVQYDAEGYHLGIAFLWGYNLDFMLNDEFVPFFKLGYGLSNSTEVEDSYEAVYGIGFHFITKYFELGGGVDRENVEYGGVRFYPDLFKESATTGVNAYINLNIRFD